MYKLPKLPYGYDALEPYIDKKTMTIHHTKHHQGYVNNINKVIEKYPELGDKTLEEILVDLDSVPADVKTVVRQNGGGHWNHRFFWEIMAPPKKGGGGGPNGKLAKAIASAFGSFESFKEKFKKAGLTRFGSGWAWLAIDHDGALQISSTPNQDNPLMNGKDAILGADVWEHAYYLKYQNRRGDYLDAFWNVVNWEQVAKLYAQVAL